MPLGQGVDKHCDIEGFISSLLYPGGEWCVCVGGGAGGGGGVERWLEAGREVEFMWFKPDI